jgi:hypothetical protein
VAAAGPLPVRMIDPAASGRLEVLQPQCAAGVTAPCARGGHTVSVWAGVCVWASEAGGGSVAALVPGIHTSTSSAEEKNGRIV